MKFIHCDMSCNTLVPHYKHISVFLAGWEPHCVCSPLHRKDLNREKAHCSRFYFNVERIFSGRFDAHNVLLQSFNLTVKKRLKKKKEGEKL